MGTKTANNAYVLQKEQQLYHNVINAVKFTCANVSCCTHQLSPSIREAYLKIALVYLIVSVLDEDIYL